MVTVNPQTDSVFVHTLHVADAARKQLAAHGIDLGAPTPYPATVSNVSPSDTVSTVEHAINTACTVYDLCAEEYMRDREIVTISCRRETFTQRSYQEYMQSRLGVEYAIAYKETTYAPEYVSVKAEHSGVREIALTSVARAAHAEWIALNS